MIINTAFVNACDASVDEAFMNAQDVFLNGSVMNHARLLSGYRDALAMLTRETALVGRGRAASATRRGLDGGRGRASCGW